jgi:hypothetical protein
MSGQDARLNEAAFEALTRHLDEHFGECYLPTYIAEGLAAGIEAIREAGSKDVEGDVAAFLESAVPSLGDTEVLARELASLDNAGDVAKQLSDALENAVEDDDGTIDDVICDVLADYQAIGGWRSADFASPASWGMATIEMCVIVRNGQFAHFERTDVENREPYWLSESADLASDPSFRALRLDTAKWLLELGPRIWIDGDDELDDELREMTLAADLWEDWWREEALWRGVDSLVEEYVEAFASAMRLPADEAATRLAELFRAGTSNLEPERALLWEIWKNVDLD